MKLFTSSKDIKVEPREERIRIDAHAPPGTKGTEKTSQLFELAILLDRIETEAKKHFKDLTKVWVNMPIHEGNYTVAVYLSTIGEYKELINSMNLFENWWFEYNKTININVVVDLDVQDTFEDAVQTYVSSLVNLVKYKRLPWHKRLWNWMLRKNK